MRTMIVAVALLAGASVILSSCSPRKNTAASRKYQEFITRYNVYYNGDTHYKETLADMETKYEDDYSRQLFMHPIEAKGEEQAPQPSGNFDRSIEKAQKAIQLRSIKKKPAKKRGKASDPKYKAWMKRDEYNPFLHNAWMMMGRSQYYNGDFLGAASTFFYVSRHFTWLPQTVVESKLMQALSYVSMGWLFEAEMIITRIKKDELTSKNLRELYNFVYADYYLHASDYEAAMPYLELAAREADGAQKTRLNFLLGQIYARTGNKAAAYEAFRKAGSSSSAPYRTKFNARIKQSEVYSGSDIEPEVKALRRMTRYDRNKEYLDQIYYAIGNLYLSRGDTIHAIENYERANKESSRNGIDKAINQITLGNLYFQQGNYEKAQPNYSEAVPQLPKTYPDYDAIKRRSDVLDELAVYSQNVNLQDSLLRLSEMTPEEQLAVVEKIIDELKKREKEEAEAAKREEYLANQAAQGSNLNNNGSASAANSFNINSDNSWYFYNTATKNAGKTEFQKRWGSRKLEDDWRRRNKSSFNTDDFEASTEGGEDGQASGEGNTDDSGSGSTEAEMTDEEKEQAKRASDPHYPEYYLAQIPKTDAEKATSHEVVQEGLYNMGVILKDKLEDYPAAKSEFDRLLADYPDNIYRLDTYYNLYLMYMRLGDMATAEKYRRLILSDFAESKYGMALRDPNYIDNLRSMDERQQKLYDSALEAYFDNRNTEVHRAYENMNEKYPMSKIMPKFMFLHALAYVTEKKPEEFNSVLKEMLERYPDTDLTPVASAWLKGMAQGRKLQSGTGGNMRGMIWDLRLTNDSTAVAAEGPAQFDLNPDMAQLLIFTFPTDKVDTNHLLYEIARHNFRSFVVKDFDLEQMNFGRLGMIIVRGFDSMAELNHYRSVMASSTDFKIPAGVRPVAISAANFDKLLSEGRTFDDYFRYLEEQNYIDTQASLLQPEEIETLEEAEAAEAAAGEAAEIANAANIATEEEQAPTAEEEAKTATSEPIEEKAKTATPEPQQQKPVPKPAPAKPTPAPAKPTPPALPEVPPGSEGDDPLFDD